MTDYRDGDWLGRPLLDRHGASIAPIVALHADKPTGGWALVRCGRLIRRRSLCRSSSHDTDAGIIVPFSGTAVHHSPATSGGAPSAAEAERLHAHYGDLTPARAVRPRRAPRASTHAAEELERAVSAARFHADNLRLCPARNHNSGIASDQRLRELERANDNARATLGLVRDR